jgi:serine/threonine protein kinase
VEENPNDTTASDGAATDGDTRLSKSSPDLRQSGAAWPKPGVTLAERFRIQKLLGGGANGEVWQAVNIQLGVKVAIKLPNADRMNPQDLERFRREARALCLIHNEHVLRFFEYNTEPTPYLVMELLRGHDLAEHIQKHGPLSLPEAKSVCRQLCAGLQAVHDAGILHRDIKPGNIYCLGEPGKVKIVDFGLMKLVGGAGDTSVDSTRNPMKELTVDGTFLGTPQYMSPEQWSDQVIALQSDLWSLAVVLYKILTGDVPFKGKTYLALARAIRTDQAPEPSKVRGGLPPDVDAFFQRALNKDPAQRFASAVEMSQAFEAIQDKPLDGPTLSNGGGKTRDSKEKPEVERPVLSEARRFAGKWHKVLFAAAVVVLFTSSIWGASAHRNVPTPPCAPGMRDCDGRAENGCEVDITTPKNCGGCSIACANDHGQTACSGGVCAPTCDAGYADCDGAPANGCETDLSSSAGHCGRCGRACVAANGAPFCAGGDCAVACNPGFGDCNADLADGCESDLTTTSSPTTLCAPEILARTAGGKADIAVERDPDGSVYFTSPSARVVQMVPKRGGRVKTLWEQGVAADIVVGHEYVFWTDTSTGNVIKYRKGASRPEFAAEFDCKGLCAPFGLATHGERVYWTIRPQIATSEPPSLWYNEKSGPRILTDQSLVIPRNGLAAGSSGIFWASMDGPEMAFWTLGATSQDKPQRVLPVAREPSAIALDPRGDFIFWIERGSRETSFKDGAVMRTSTSPRHASRLELAASQQDPRSLAVDQAWVYWSTADGAVKKVRKDGVGAPVVLAVDPGIPAAIDVDDRYIYWVSENTGEVRMVAK